jgi:hypothetical protein
MSSTPVTDNKIPTIDRPGRPDDPAPAAPTVAGGPLETSGQAGRVGADAPRLAAQQAASALDTIGARIGRAPLRIALCAVVTTTTAMFGSADALPLAVNGVLVFAVAVAVLVLLPVPVHLRPVAAAAAGLAFALAAWSFIQALPVPLGFAHAVWTIAADGVGVASGALSIDPARTAAAIVPLMIPFAVFLATLAVSTDDEAALGVLKVLALSGGAFAVFAIVQFELAPGTLIAIEKTAYLDSLTAPFVNRNTAATYYAMVAMLAFAFLVGSRPSLDNPAQVGSMTASQSRVVWGGVMLTALVALALTNSRAGLAATVCAFALAAPMMATGGSSRGSSSGFGSGPDEPGSRRLVVAGGAVAAVIAAALFLGGRSLWRLDVAGLADNRFCILPRTLDLAAANWITGTGLGTFEAAYVGYRDPACGIYGAWDSAHNVYLDAFVTLGVIVVPAIVAVVAVLVAIFLAGVRSRRRLRAFPIAGLGLVTLVALHSLFDFSIEIAGFSAPFAAATAAIVALSLGRQSRAR